MVTILPFLVPLWLMLARRTGRQQLLSEDEVGWISALELVPLLTYRRWLDREMDVPWYYMFTHPLAGALFTSILAQSTWRILTRKGVDWSGRHYYRER
jgi:hypothetical protein